MLPAESASVLSAAVKALHSSIITSNSVYPRRPSLSMTGGKEYADFHEIYVGLAAPWGLRLGERRKRAEG